MYDEEFFFRCWYAGSLWDKRGKVGFSEPLITPDLGFMRSWMVFEVLEAQVYKNDILPFHLKDHCERLAASAKLAEIDRSKHLADIIESQVAVFFFAVFQHFRELSKYKIKECLVWIYLTKGRTEDGFYAASNNPVLYVFLSRKPRSSNKSLHLMTVNTLREFPEIKTTNYLFAEMFLAKKAHDNDILYVFDDKTNGKFLLETSRRNFCVVKNGTIVTCGKKEALAGVTLKIIRELAEKGGLAFCEECIPSADLQSCSEAFTTSTTRGVVPVVQIDDMRFHIGPVAKKLQAAFQQYRRTYFQHQRAEKKRIGQKS